MKRFLVSVMLMFSCWLASGQVYTGGKGDGAAISCVPPVVTTLSQTSFTCVSDTIVLAVHATGTNLNIDGKNRERISLKIYCLRIVIWDWERILYVSLIRQALQIPAIIVVWWKIAVMKISVRCSISI